MNRDSLRLALLSLNLRKECAIINHYLISTQIYTQRYQSYVYKYSILGAWVMERANDLGLFIAIGKKLYINTGKPRRREALMVKIIWR